MKREEANEGVLHAFYTQKGWFVKVKQAYGIGRVCFSFVEKGKNGSGFDIYMCIDKMDNLCDDILSYRLLKAILEDKGDYPAAYKFVTGEDGCKELNIGSGKSQPIVIQGRDKTANMNAFVGVGDYDDLRTLAKWFRRTTEKYNEEMAQLCINAKMHKPKEDDLKHSPAAENNSNSSSDEQSVTEAKATETQGPEIKEPAVAPTQDTPELLKMVLTTTISGLVDMKTPGNKCMQAEKPDGTIINLVFLESDIKAIESGKWKRFEEMCEQAKEQTFAKFACDCIMQEKNGKPIYYFKGFSK